MNKTNNKKQMIKQKGKREEEIDYETEKKTDVRRELRHPHDKQRSGCLVCTCFIDDMGSVSERSSPESWSLLILHQH